MSIKGTILVLLALLLSACSKGGEGTIALTIYGESFIEDGIPASAVGDGWGLKFSRFDVSIEDVIIAGENVSVPASVDLLQPSFGKGQELASVLLPAGEYAQTSFVIARVEVAGTATKGTETKSFSWVFDEPTHYSECDPITSVVEGGTTIFQITVHADHLLYDSLVSDLPQLLFQALADADTDEDGDITQAELAVTDIGFYDPGS